ncbi:MAG: hypothetical protein RJB01_794 [Actinomycetota bacterium]
MNVETSVATATNSRKIFGQPAGLTVLATTELWERFSFYGMRAILVLYLTAGLSQAGSAGPGLGLDAGAAAAIYGSYLALVYVTPIGGGWIADRVVGARRAVLIGGIVIASGHFSMALPTEISFWLGLLLIALGTGLLKPSISAMVGELYRGSTQTRQDAGFSIFYMGINIGAFLAPLLVGSLAAIKGWHWGFALAGIGMCVALIIYIAGRRTLGDAGNKPRNPVPTRELEKVVVAALAGIGIFVMVAAGVGVSRGDFIQGVATTLAWTVVLIALIYIWRMFHRSRIRYTERERSRLKGFMYLFVLSIFFWMIFDQAGSTLTIFAQNWTSRDIGAWEMPAAWLQSLNPIMIIIFAPIFAWLWIKLANRAPSVPLKFAIAIVGMGLSFVILVIPGISADDKAMSAVWWLVVAYLIQTWSELLLSPTGLSAACTLAPQGMTSQVLALWFLSTAIGDAVGGQILDAISGRGFAFIFAFFGILALVVGSLALAFVKPVKRLIA